MPYERLALPISSQVPYELLALVQYPVLFDKLMYGFLFQHFVTLNLSVPVINKLTFIQQERNELFQH